VRQRAPYVERRTPRVALDEELGQLVVREDRIVARGLGEARETGEAGKHIRRVEGARLERAFDPQSKALRTRRFHDSRLGCSERPGTLQRIVPSRHDLACACLITCQRSASEAAELRGPGWELQIGYRSEMIRC
jgi:hypothetical protein